MKQLKLKFDNKKYVVIFSHGNWRIVVDDPKNVVYWFASANASPCDSRSAPRFGSEKEARHLLEQVR